MKFLLKFYLFCAEFTVVIHKLFTTGVMALVHEGCDKNHHFNPMHLWMYQKCTQRYESVHPNKFVPYLIPDHVVTGRTSFFLCSYPNMRYQLGINGTYQCLHLQACHPLSSEEWIFHVDCISKLTLFFPYAFFLFEWIWLQSRYKV